MVESPDSVLIQATLDGEESAFAELVGRYQRAVWGMVHRTLGNPAEGEDAVQEIFLRALVSLGKFDLRCPFGPWILRIAGNYCIDQLRRRRTRRYRLWSDLTESEKGSILANMCLKPDVENISEEERAAYLGIARSLLDRLKPKYRVAFVLREVEGRSYEAVSEIMRVSESTARVWVHRARAGLHKEFRRYVAASEKGTRNEQALRPV